MSVLRLVAWHLSGFVILGGIAWGALTLMLMMPDAQYWWASWAVSGAILVKTALVVVTLLSGYLAVMWLVSPAEVD